MDENKFLDQKNSSIEFESNSLLDSETVKNLLSDTNYLDLNLTDNYLNNEKIEQINTDNQLDELKMDQLNEKNKSLDHTNNTQLNRDNQLNNQIIYNEEKLKSNKIILNEHSYSLNKNLIGDQSESINYLPVEFDNEFNLELDNSMEKDNKNLNLSSFLYLEQQKTTMNPSDLDEELTSENNLTTNQISDQLTNDKNLTNLDNKNDNSSVDDKSNDKTPSRRSKRQIEKVERTTSAKKSKNENQKSIKKCKDQLNITESSNNLTKDNESINLNESIQEIEHSSSNIELNSSKKTNRKSASSTKSLTTTPVIERISTRPQREKRLPKRLADSEIDMGFHRTPKSTEKKNRTSKKIETPKDDKNLLDLKDDKLNDSEQEELKKEIEFTKKDLTIEKEQSSKEETDLNKDSESDKEDQLIKETELNKEETELNKEAESDKEDQLIKETELNKEDEFDIKLNDEDQSNQDKILEEEKQIKTEEVDLNIQIDNDNSKNIDDKNEDQQIENQDEQQKANKDDQINNLNLNDDVNDLKKDEKINEEKAENNSFEIDEKMDVNKTEEKDNENVEQNAIHEKMDAENIENIENKKEENNYEIEKEKIDDKKEEEQQSIKKDKKLIENQFSIDDKSIDSSVSKTSDESSTSKTSKDSITKLSKSATDDEENKLKIDEKSDKLSKKQSVKEKQDSEFKSSKHKEPEKSDRKQENKRIPKPLIKQDAAESEDDEDGSDNADAESEDWCSEDDPDKLWCTCQKPFNNRFMIRCDRCLYWYHGNCVNISQSQGTAYEKQGKKWFCQKCKNNELNDRKLLPDKKLIKQKHQSQHDKSHDRPKFLKQKSMSNLEKRKSSIDNQLNETPKLKRKSLDDDNQIRKRRSSSSSIKNEEEEEKLKLTNLIKNKKTELQNKSKSLNDSNRIEKRKSLDNRSNDKLNKSIEKSHDKLHNKSTSSSLNKSSIELNQSSSYKKQDDNKKKKSSLSLDPSIEDLFKPEDFQSKIIQKSVPKRPSISSPNSKSSNSIDFTICIAKDCKKPTQKINDKKSNYCSKECIDKYAYETIKLNRKIKIKNARTSDELNNVKADNKKVTLLDKRNNKILTGKNAILEEKIAEFLLKNPSYEILLPSLNKQSTNLNSKKEGSSSNLNKSSSSLPSKNKQSSISNQNSKDSSSINNKKSTEISKTLSKEDEIENYRQNARKQLRKTFFTRLENCKDFEIEKTEVKKIASKIESELFILFKGIDKNYKNRLRSLVFNLGDIQNEGLFKKVLTGKLQPDNLVKMDSEKLASSQLAQWRERESRHLLEMIKKDAVQSVNQVVVKKTHKGEEVIETKANLPEFDELTGKKDKNKDTSTNQMSIKDELNKDKQSFKSTNTTSTSQQTSNSQNSSSTAKIVSAKEKSNLNPLDLLFKDTTKEHGQHLFDLHCKICTNQTKEDLSLVHKPKTSLELNKNNNESSLPNLRRQQSINSNLDEQSPTQLTKAPPISIWNGYISFQEVSKFMSFAYVVSGSFETQDILFESIQVCGRIAPEQVFYYLKRIKDTSRNEITILKFIPANDAERVGYESFFQYLSQRRRFAVVGNAGKSIKDFYLFPLAKDEDINEELLPFEGGAGLEKKNLRPNLLIGILIKKKHSNDQIGRDNDKDYYSPPSHNQQTPSYKHKSYEIGSTTPPPQVNENHSKSAHKRSYTPPLNIESNSNSNDVSYTPPRKQIDQSDDPYDPENIFDLPIKKQKLNDHHHDHHHHHHRKSIDENKDLKESKNKVVSTSDLVNLIEHLSKNSKLCENGLTTTVLLGEISKIISIEQQEQLSEQIKRKIEESKERYEIKRRAAESAFNQATITSNFDSNVIPGLDGDFSSLNKSNDESVEIDDSVLIPKDLYIPDSLRKFLEEFNDGIDKNLNENKTIKKTNLLDDEIIKKYAKISEIDNSIKKDETEPEEMEIDEDDAQTDTIIEVNSNLIATNFTSTSSITSSTIATTSSSINDQIKNQDLDEILVEKARMQLDFLNKMKHEQELLLRKHKKDE